VNGRSFLAALWNRRLSALSVLLVEMAAVVFWLALAPKSYTAVATITATPRSSLLQSTGNFDDLETTLAAITNSRPVVEDVAARLKGARSVATLRNEITGARATGTVLIQISVVDSDATLAATIANATADVLPLHDPSGGLFVFTDAGRAVTPTATSSPNVKVTLLAGLGLGLLLAVATALIRENFVGTVDTEEQLSESAGVEVLGQVARPSDLGSLPIFDPGTEFLKEFRALRVALEFASTASPARTVVLACAVPDSADGWLGVNLAAALADVEHRVLLVDADFRSRPRHPALDLRERPGLVDVLSETASLESAIVDGPVYGLSVLPIGDINAATAAKLVELRFHKLMEEVNDGFDIVLVLAAPPTESEDARVMAAGGCLVLSVPAGKLRTKSLKTLTSAMRRANVQVLGTVLLGARRRRSLS